MQPPTSLLRALIVGAFVAIACTAPRMAVASTTKEIFELDALKMMGESAEERVSRLENERQKQSNKDLERRNKAIKEFDNLDVCLLYGYIVRNERIDIITTLKEPEDIEKILREARRRKITLDKKSTIGRIIKIGMTTCQLYASYGGPKKVNRTVGAWGEHVQYVYTSQYIYTKNGRITSWQD